MLGGFKDKVLEFFGIHSPSRWGGYVGRMVILGIANEMEDGLSLVSNAADELKDAAMSPFGTSIAQEASRLSIDSRTGADQGILSRLDMLISILEDSSGGTQELHMQIGKREAVRAFREMGVAFR